MGFLKRELSDGRIEEIATAVSNDARDGNLSAARKAAQPLVRVQKQQLEAARALARLVERGSFERSDGLELAAALFDAHHDDVVVLSDLGSAFESLHEVNFLNAAPPSEALFGNIARQLSRLTGELDDREGLAAALQGLATAARLLGRTWDAVAERAYQRLVELDPSRPQHHYGLGLFYKTRSRFSEGQAANQKAFDLAGTDRSDGILWNLGICATGARDGETALRVWKELDQKLELGRFALPEGGYDSVKVRLAERPLARRDPASEPDDPGKEETIWIERLSPCHGIVRSALYCDEIGVDFGDVVLFDGAPITHHKYADSQVPVFPHLVTLKRPGYRVFPFAGTQKRDSQIADLSKKLPEDAVLYVHTEQFAVLCASCWNDPGIDHAIHSTTERHVVTGKLCTPPSVTAPALLAALDDALNAVPEVRVFVPDLAAAAGHPERAEVERRRLAMIRNA